jgi:hypothetical protein
VVNRSVHGYLLQKSVFPLELDAPVFRLGQWVGDSIVAFARDRHGLTAHHRE